MMENKAEHHLNKVENCIKPFLVGAHRVEHTLSIRVRSEGQTDL